MAQRNPPNGDSGKNLYSFQSFQGVNTRASRNAIGADQFAFLENYQPVGPGNLKPLYGPAQFTLTIDPPGTVTTNAAFSDAVRAIASQGLNTVVALSDGSARQYIPATRNIVYSNKAFAGELTVGGVRATFWPDDGTLLYADTLHGFGYSDPVTGHATFGVANAPTAATDVAAFQGRVWVANGNTIYFSAPGSYTDWTAANGASSVKITDSAFVGPIQRLYAANSYLYVFGTTGINVIADVQVPTGVTPPTPIFSNVNIEPVVGLDFPDSLFAWSRTICFGSRYGFFGIDGVTVTRLSADIDDTIQQIAPKEFFSGNSYAYVSGCAAILNSILCACWCFQWLDPNNNGIERTLMACYFDRKWFFASQRLGNLTRVAQIISGGPGNFYGILWNGSLDPTKVSTQLVSLNVDPTVALTYTVRTPLWSMGNPYKGKQVLKVAMEGLLTTNGGTPILYMEEQSNNSYPITLTPGQLPWVNGAGITLPWVNGAGAILPWVQGGLFREYWDADSFYGKYVGLRYTNTLPQMTINSFGMQYELREDF